MSVVIDHSLLALLPVKLIRNSDHESDDQTSAMTAAAISTVPPQPNPRSHDFALKRPIKFIFEIITIITTIIGTATMFSTALQISILIGSMLVRQPEVT